jgi:hypothetical protein
LSYTYDTNAPGGTLTSTDQSVTNAGGHPVMITHDCNTTRIAITGLAGGTSTSQPATSQPSTGFTATFQPPNLQCGSVIFVNVPILGTPTATVVP